MSEGPPFSAGVRGASGGASGGFGVVSGPRSSCFCTTYAMLAKLCLLCLKWLAPWFRRVLWFRRGLFTASGGFGMVSVPDPAPFSIAYAMLGPLVLEGAVVSAGAVQALRTQCLVPSVSEGGVVSETFMRTRTKCPRSQAGAGACSIL